jgi:hypothetical protein
MITVTISDKFLCAGISAAAAARIGLSPADPMMDAQQWLQWHCQSIAQTYGNQFRVSSVSSGDFVLRFTATEFAAINAAAATDPHIAGFIARVRESEWVVLSSAEVVGGMQYLVEVELLTQERAAEIISWGPVDEPEPEPVEPEGEE